MRGFARLSMLAIVVTIVTGIVQMFRLDGGHLFGTGHGRVRRAEDGRRWPEWCSSALSARQFANHRLARANEMTVPMADRLRRAFGIEAAIGVVTLVASAWLLALTPANVSTEPRYRLCDHGSRSTIVEAELDGDRRGSTATASGSPVSVEVDAPDEGLSGPRGDVHRAGRTTRSARSRSRCRSPERASRSASRATGPAAHGGRRLDDAAQRGTPTGVCRARRRGSRS